VKKIKIKFDQPILPSGISVTTLFNTLTTMMTWFNVLISMRAANTHCIEERFLDFGFLIKLQTTSNVVGSTFLKKIVCSTSEENQYVFTNLLGINMKFGVCKKGNLKDIYGKLKPNGQYTDFIHQFLSDVASGYASTQMNPLSKAIYDKFCKFAVNDRYLSHHDDYAILNYAEACHQVPLNEVDWSPLYQRYNTSAAELQQLIDYVVSFELGKTPNEELRILIAKIVAVDYKGESLIERSEVDEDFLCEKAFCEEEFSL